MYIAFPFTRQASVENSNGVSGEGFVFNSGSRSALSFSVPGEYVLRYTLLHFRKVRCGLLRTTGYVLLTTHCLLLTAYYLLLISYYFLLATYYYSPKGVPKELQPRWGAGSRRRDQRPAATTIWQRKTDVQGAADHCSLTTYYKLRTTHY